ncbi:dienelactone hydrolase family protein [Altererythrobacter sp. CAU 1778]
MCDSEMLTGWDKDAKAKGLSRRQFGVLGGAATLAACAGMTEAQGDAAGLSEGNVTYAGPGGQVDGFFVHPATGKHPAVIFWPDIAGLREAKRMMARRLASSGYAVLVVNPYYRDVAGEQFTDFAAFRSEEGFQKVGPWRDKLKAEAIVADAKAHVAWLDGQDVVDSARGIGTQGYCMGGPFTVWSAYAAPSRVKAAGSFHGGGLATDSDMSPHKLLSNAPASYLFAIAQNDDEKAPGDKVALRDAAAAASVPAEIEVYPADHGWCVPDSPAYDRDAAERAWGRLLATYSAAL